MVALTTLFSYIINPYFRAYGIKGIFSEKKSPEPAPNYKEIRKEVFGNYLKNRLEAVEFGELKKPTIKSFLYELSL